MTIFNYTHCFSEQLLKNIISDYLELHPYFDSLLKALKNYILAFQQIEIYKRHNQNEEHPIRLPKNCYNLRQLTEQTIQKTAKANVQYIYPLPIIIEVINSHQFYDQLPKNLLVNGLLTTTNISIIIQTLKIISQIQGKLILTTINSIQDKQLTTFINVFIKDYIQTQNQIKLQNNSNNQIAEEQQQTNLFNFLGNLFQKGLNIMNDNNKMNNFAQNKISKDQSLVEINLNLNKKSKNIISNRVSSFLEMISSKDLRQKQHIAQSLRNFITEKSIKTNKAIQKTIFKDCQYCKNYRGYLIQSTGLSYFDLNQISKLNSQSTGCLRKIKSIINIFTLYLKQNNIVNIPASLYILNHVLKDINLVITQQVWESSRLNPKIVSIETKGKRKSSQNQNLFTELQPYFKNVYNYSNSKQNQFNLNEIFRMCLHAQPISKIQKKLIQQYSLQEKIKNQNKDIQIYCLKHQKLNKLHKKSFDFSQIQNKQKETQKSFSKENSFNQIILLKDYQKQQQIINKAKAHTKPIHCLINQNQSQNQKQPFIQPNPNKSIKSLPISYNISMKSEQSNLTKVNNKTKQIDKNQLTNDNFKLILYQQFMRNNGFNIKNSLTNSNISQLNFFNNRSGKQNHQKAETDYDKKQSEIYNKMLLNGEVIKNQIIKQLEYEDAVIYSSYEQCPSGLLFNDQPKVTHKQKKNDQKFTKLQKRDSKISINLQNVRQSDFQNQKLEIKQKQNKQLRKQQLKAKLKIQERPSKKINVNAIVQNSLKFNQSGIIRNQKYNKSIKSVLRGIQINNQKQELQKRNKKYHYYDTKSCMRSVNRGTVNSSKSVLATIYKDQVNKLNSMNQTFVKTNNFIF